MGRQRATVEYLEKLVEWAGGRAEFCRLTGILQPNLTAYLNASKSVSWQRLESATAQVFGEPPAFVPVVEGHDLRAEPSLTVLPKVGGLYGLFDSAVRLVYYGKATNLRAEVGQTLKRRVGEVRPWTDSKNLTFKQIIAYGTPRTHTYSRDSNQRLPKPLAPVRFRPAALAARPPVLDAASQWSGGRRDPDPAGRLLSER